MSRYFILASQSVMTTNILTLCQPIRSPHFEQGNKNTFGLVWFNLLECFFGSEGHVALDRNPGPGYDTLLLRMIPGDLLKCISP